MPEDMKFAHPDLEKDLILPYQLAANNENRDEDLTEENNYDDIPLDHLELDEKEFNFNVQGEIVEPKQVAKTYEDYVDMPALKQTFVKNKKEKKGHLNDPSKNSEEEMMVSGLSEESSTHIKEGLIKAKEEDRYRRNQRNKRIAEQNYVGEDSSDNIIIPGRGKGNKGVGINEPRNERQELFG